MGLIVILGLISAGISTLEGLIQALSTTITADIIKPLFGHLFPKEEVNRSRREIMLNKLVIAFLALITIYLSYDQLVSPKLSVAIFAQNGVYAYFAAAFVPILFGMFIPEVPKSVVISASVTAVLIHFLMYYGKLPVPYTLSTGENPGVAAAVAICASLLSAFIVLFYHRLRKNHESV